MDIASLREAYAAGDRVADLIEARTARIERTDTGYAAVLQLNPERGAIARRLDGVGVNARGALHGIPVLIKDNVETADMPTTAGAHVLEGLATGRDATAVARLREAGAVVLGKANLSEWANFRSERSSSGWSGLGGQTRNALASTRSPCGSSSGSAVSVALGYVPLAVGTETNGSVVCPAAINGIVGFKPTVGHIPIDGIIPIAHTQDTAGPMARTVPDAALGYAIMAGLDPRVVARELRQASLTGKRIGVLRSETGYHDGVDAVFERALGALTDAGAILVEDLRLEPYPGFSGDTYTVLLHEFHHDLNAWFASLPAPARVGTLDELIAFNEAHAEQTMPWFRQEIFVKAAATDGLDSATYRGALARIHTATRAGGIDRLLDEHDIDVLVAPTNGPAWTIDLVNGDHHGGGFSTYPAVAGYPHLTVPMGTLHGLPLGLSITGGQDRDLEVLAVGKAFEALGSRPALGGVLPE